MKMLSPLEHWDVVHHGEERAINLPSEVEGQAGLFRGRAGRMLKRLLGTNVLQRMSAYDEYLLWNVIFPRHLPDCAGGNVLEVGSAPGEFVVKFARKYRCIPYGVEYSKPGVELNRRVFDSSGFPPANVIHADFFSEDFQQRYRGSFDVVISRGFIEHFTDVEAVLSKHANLLKPGGCLVVSIPNLTGVNYGLVRCFHKDVIAIHNLDIMRKDVFARLFERIGAQSLYCDYYGTFTFFLFNVKDGSSMRHALAASHKIQPMLNLMFRATFKDKGFESRVCSPYLLFVGRMPGAATSNSRTS